MTRIGIGDAADRLAGEDIGTDDGPNAKSVAGPQHAPPQHRHDVRRARPSGTIDALRRDAWHPAEAGGITR